MQERFLERGKQLLVTLSEVKESPLEQINSNAMSTNSYYVYILTSENNRVLYIGVTNDLVRRVAEHKIGLSKFTATYSVHKLVYFEECCDVNAAIAREKQLKGWSRQKKEQLLSQLNPNWRDLTWDWEN